MEIGQYGHMTEKYIWIILCKWWRRGVLWWILSHKEGCELWLKKRVRTPLNQNNESRKGINFEYWMSIGSKYMQSFVTKRYKSKHLSVHEPFSIWHIEFYLNFELMHHFSIFYSSVLVVMTILSSREQWQQHEKEDKKIQCTKKARKTKCFWLKTPPGKLLLPNITGDSFLLLATLALPSKGWL